MIKLKLHSTFDTRHDISKDLVSKYIIFISVQHKQSALHPTWYTW